MSIILYRFIFSSLFIFIISNCFSQKWEKESDSVFVSNSKYPFIEYRIDTTDITDYFDCTKTKVFDDKPLPKNSEIDYVNLKRYKRKLEQIYSNNGGYINGSELYYLSCIKGEVDTVMEEWIASKQNTFSFHSLKYWHAKDIISSAGFIVGKIVAKKIICDSTICLFYSKKYIVQVLDIIHNYPNCKITVGQKILLEFSNGSITCHTNGRLEFFDAGSAFFDFPVNFVFAFRLEHNSYLFHFLNGHTKDDRYCPHAMQMPYFDVPISKETIYDMKLFVNEYFNK